MYWLISGKARKSDQAVGLDNSKNQTDKEIDTLFKTVLTSISNRQLDPLTFYIPQGF